MTLAQRLRAIVAPRISDQRLLHEAADRIEKLEALVEAVRKADVQRDPRHRVSMLANDWTAISAALAALEEIK